MSHAQEKLAKTARIRPVSSGFTYTYTSDAGAKTGTIDAASIRSGGAPLDMAARYRMTMNKFLAGGAATVSRCSKKEPIG